MPHTLRHHEPIHPQRFQPQHLEAGCLNCRPTASDPPTVGTTARSCECCEEIAAEHLKKNRFRILARGFRLFRGELDIIAQDRKALVFIEVKTRRSTHFGEPVEAVTPRKQRQIRKIAQGYLTLNHLEDVECRFDIISVLIGDDGRYLISVDETTVVVDLKSAAVVARWLGKPQQVPYERSFAAFEGAPIGFMEFAEGCDGILAYHPLLSGGSRCLKGVKGAVWSPDRRSIAFSRLLRQGSSSSMVTDDRWSAVILDIGSGREIEAARDLRSDFQPFLRWNTEGTRLLVEWPGFRPGI